ncbi:hypothetical protein Y695_04360 [Hydrogenophaga sp. T4]|nr:hypothetical protein Y695_04360 [Hydrogenophaga sp. T4]
MDSTTTTASSTSMPSAITTPSSTETLTVWPRVCSTAKVPSSENGMPMVTSRPMRQPRNTQHTASTRSMPNKALVSMTPMASRVGTVWSSVSTSFSPDASNTLFWFWM